MLIKKLFYLFAIAILFTSCSGDDLSMQERFDKEVIEIEAYIKTKGWTAQKTVEGIYYVIDEAGSVDKPTIVNVVRVNYAGQFMDGIAFDAGSDVQFSLSSVIQGWQIGIPKFGRGGKGKLIIPSKYAYGDRTINGRSNQILVFDVTLIDYK